MFRKQTRQFSCFYLNLLINTFERDWKVFMTSICLSTWCRLPVVCRSTYACPCSSSSENSRIYLKSIDVVIHRSMFSIGISEPPWFSMVSTDCKILMHDATIISITTISEETLQACNKYFQQCPKTFPRKLQENLANRPAKSIYAAFVLLLILYGMYKTSKKYFNFTLSCWNLCNRCSRSVKPRSYLLWKLFQRQIIRWITFIMWHRKCI